MKPMASTPQPPYYAVLFTSVRTDADDDEYSRTAERMIELAAAQPGFLGIEHARGADGLGITISYWNSPESIRRWQQHAEHLQAQANGKAKWYERYQLRVCRVERAYGFEASE
jgi:heme-degrading monooxygenase HmoA